MTLEQVIIFRWVGYFSITLIFWFGLFFWSRYIAYPLELRKRIKKGKSWMYIPLWWKENRSRQNGTRAGTVFIALLAVGSSLLFFGFGVKLMPSVTLFLTIPLAFLVWFLFRKSVVYVPNLEADCYYLLYRRFARDYEHAFSEAELKNRTTWKFNDLLLKADKQHHFLKYVKTMAASEEIPETEFRGNGENHEAVTL